MQILYRKFPSFSALVLDASFDMLNQTPKWVPFLSILVFAVLTLAKSLISQIAHNVQKTVEVQLWVATPLNVLLEQALELSHSAKRRYTDRGFLRWHYCSHGMGLVRRL